MIHRHFHMLLLPVLMAIMVLLLLSGCAGGDRAVADRGLTTCFLDFTDVYQDRIYQVLKSAPGVDRIERLWSGSCEKTDNCLCYRLEYSGPIEELTAWLKQNLPLNKTMPFHFVYPNAHHLEVVFDAGFR